MFTDRNASARVGEVIADRFRLERLIGVGAMGAVYRAVHEWTQRKVAVKLLFDDSNPAEAIERFFREARAATRIGHRNIVEVLDMGQHSDGTYYLAQELLEGETLRQRLDRLRKLSTTETFELLLPVMDALTAAHAAGVIHRDVKPENIILHAERKTSRAAKVVPKLIDFGVAKAGDHPVRLTAAGAVLGTPNYMAPEQIEGSSEVGPQADLWSLGVILYECLSGERPFSAPTVRDLFAQICTTSAPPLKSLVPTLPDELANIVHCALERDRTQRFGSVHAMVSALSSVTPLAEAPALAVMFESLAAPMVPRSATDARGANKTTPLVRTPVTPATPQQPPASVERQSSAGDGRPRRSASKSSRSNAAQIAMGVGLGVAIAAFGAFTIRGAARTTPAPPTHTNSTALDAGALPEDAAPTPVIHAPADAAPSAPPEARAIPARSAPRRTQSATPVQRTGASTQSGGRIIE